MTELPFERAAMRGEPMSDSLDFIDAVMYQGLAALYFRFFQKAITQEQGQIEKKHLMRKYTVERNLKPPKTPTEKTAHWRTPTG